MSGNVTLAFPGFSAFFKEDSPPPSSDTLRAPHHCPTCRISLYHRLHHSFTPCPRATGGSGSLTYGAPGGLPAELQHRPPSRFQR